MVSVRERGLYTVLFPNPDMGSPVSGQHVLGRTASASLTRHRWNGRTDETLATGSLIPSMFRPPALGRWYVSDVSLTRQPLTLPPPLLNVSHPKSLASREVHEHATFYRVQVRAVLTQIRPCGPGESDRTPLTPRHGTLDASASCLFSSTFRAS